MSSVKMVVRPKTVYTHEPGQYGDLISQHDGTSSKFYHFDARGDTREITDESENVTDTRTYDAWGNVVASTGSTPTPYQFVGKLGYAFDSALDQYYIRARWYTPPSGRWETFDPTLGPVSPYVPPFIPMPLIPPTPGAGLPALRLSIEPGTVRGNGECGSKVGVYWQFKVLPYSPCDGYLVQQVAARLELDYQCCETGPPLTHDIRTANYWEAWGVSYGKPNVSHTNVIPPEPGNGNTIGQPWNDGFTGYVRPYSKGKLTTAGTLYLVCKPGTPRIPMSVDPLYGIIDYPVDVIPTWSTWQYFGKNQRGEYDPFITAGALHARSNALRPFGSGVRTGAKPRHKIRVEWIAAT